MGNEIAKRDQPEPATTVFPNVYRDNQLVGEFADQELWPNDRLEQYGAMYQQFLGRDDIMERAREGARRVLLHLGFEYACRRAEDD